MTKTEADVSLDSDRGVGVGIYRAPVRPSVCEADLVRYTQCMQTNRDLLPCHTLYETYLQCVSPGHDRQ